MAEVWARVQEFHRLRRAVQPQRFLGRSGVRVVEHQGVAQVGMLRGLAERGIVPALPSSSLVPLKFVDSPMRESSD